MENIYCKNVDVKFDLTANIPPEYANTTGLYATVPKSTLDSRLTELLSSVGLTVKLVDIAYIPPHSKGGTANGVPIHTDGWPNEYTQCKLLWCFGNSPGTMNWYVPSEGDHQYKKKLTDSKTYYAMLDLADASKVWSTEIANPSLINASIAHSVDNHTDQGQWFTSVALGDLENNFATWDDVCNRLAPYFK